MDKPRFISKLSFDRLLSKSLFIQLAILVIVLVLALGLSYLLLFSSGTQWNEFCEAEHLNKYLLPLYLLIDSNALNNLYMGSDNTHVHGWMLIASSLIFLFGAFVFNGIIIGVITNSIEQRVKNYKEGRIHYLKSGHYIIMGYDDMVPSIITYIFNKDKNAYILILSSAKSDEIREKLCKPFNETELKQIIINYGHRVSAEAFKEIHLESAVQVFVVGNHTRSEHDAINVECLDSIGHYLEKQDKDHRPSRITCMFKDLDTYAAFKTSEIFMKIEALGVEFIPYNFYAGWAKQVFIKRKYHDMDNPDMEYQYPAVYGKGCLKDGNDEGDETALTRDDSRYVHLVFVGTTNFAVSFAMEAAQVLHFPNFSKNDNLKTRITFIDINADTEKDEFIVRNQHFFDIQSYLYKDLTESSPLKAASSWLRAKASSFGCKSSNRDFLDVEFEFIKGNVFSENVQNEIRQWAKDHNQKQYLSIFLAQADQRQNFVMGMNMPDEVYVNEIPVFIRQDRSDNFVTRLRKKDLREVGDKLTYYRVEKGKLIPKQLNARYANLYPFGMNETGFCEDERSLKRAKLINYLYCTADYSVYKFQDLLVLDSVSTDRIWKEANDLWKKLTVALKWSNLYSAYTIRTKLAILRSMRGLKLDDVSHDFQPLSDIEVETLAIVEHNRWNVEKLLMGYRKAREDEDKYEHQEFERILRKNKDLFIHHDIRPFDKLDDVKKLDYEFSRYIPWIMKMTEESK